MRDLDPAAVMAEHGQLHICIGGLYWNMRVNGDKCEPYRLAEALAASEAKVARFDNILDQYTDGKISKVACVSLMLNAADS